jgi:hypothetical protein
MRTQIPARFRIRTKVEARCTLKESLLIDRGFLPDRLTLIVILAALGLWALAPMGSMGLIGLLALDYVWFVVHRRRILHEYEAGAPRLTTPADFEAVAESFQQTGVPEPTMTDWHVAAGFSEVPQWRQDLRYRIAASYYQRGVLLDVGCGDGRLCWRYGERRTASTLRAPWFTDCAQVFVAFPLFTGWDGASRSCL